jgi:hypothetical protein
MKRKEQETKIAIVICSKRVQVRSNNGSSEDGDFPDRPNSDKSIGMGLWGAPNSLPISYDSRLWC